MMTDERRTISPRLYTIAGVILILIWAAAIVATDAPGWIHLLLSVGLFLVVYGIVQSS